MFLQALTVDSHSLQFFVLKKFWTKKKSLYILPQIKYNFEDIHVQCQKVIYVKSYFFMTTITVNLNNFKNVEKNHFQAKFCYSAKIKVKMIT